MARYELDKTPDFSSFRGMTALRASYPILTEKLLIFDIFLYRGHQLIFRFASWIGRSLGDQMASWSNLMYTIGKHDVGFLLRVPTTFLTVY